MIFLQNFFNSFSVLKNVDVKVCLKEVHELVFTWSKRSYISVLRVDVYSVVGFLLLFLNYKTKPNRNWSVLQQRTAAATFIDGWHEMEKNVHTPTQYSLRHIIYTVRHTERGPRSRQQQLSRLPSSEMWRRVVG
jgi:hypothetical protein